MHSGGKELRTINDTHYESMAANDVDYWWHFNRIRMVNAILAKYSERDRSFTRILDYGCGTGGALYSLKKNHGFMDVTGVDISAMAIDHARRRGDWYYHLKPGACDYVEGKDVVLCLDVLEHIENDRLFIKGILSKMKTGAFLLVTVPSMPGLLSKWDKVLGHYRRYNTAMLRNLFITQQCEILNIHHFFSYLTPMALLRKIDMFGSGEEFPAVPTVINNALKVLGFIEMEISRCIHIPFGLSLACIIKKTEF